MWLICLTGARQVRDIIRARPRAEAPRPGPRAYRIKLLLAQIQGFRVSGLGFRVRGFGLGVWGLGFRLSGLGVGV